VDFTQIFAVNIFYAEIKAEIFGYIARLRQKSR
jgi:hypothetical protein